MKIGQDIERLKAPKRSILSIRNGVRSKKHLNRMLLMYLQGKLNKILVMMCSVSPQALELIERLLTLDPKRRISAADALESSYFWSDPMTCQPHE